MKRFEQWAFIFIILPFLIIFQNCDHNTNNSKTNLLSQNEQIGDLGISSLKLPAASSTSPESEEEVLIDIYKSTIESTNGQAYCPGYNFFYSLQDILQEASICKTSQTSQINTACALEFQTPEAILLSSNGTETKLGNMNAQCETVHLCSPYKEEFQMLIQKFLEVKEMFACPN